ncbi:hypothetical protein GCM10010228_14930 [Streptomyces massasporeus]|nr:hypothetical protein GCM10010228_14930 [Streptomyces massasporeus]
MCEKSDPVSRCIARAETEMLRNRNQEFGNELPGERYSRSARIKNACRHGSREVRIRTPRPRDRPGERRPWCTGRRQSAYRAQDIVPRSP